MPTGLEVINTLGPRYTDCETPSFLAHLEDNYFTDNLILGVMVYCPYTETPEIKLQCNASVYRHLASLLLVVLSVLRPLTLSVLPLPDVIDSPDTETLCQFHLCSQVCLFLLK